MVSDEIELVKKQIRGEVGNRGNSVLHPPSSPFTMHAFETGMFSEKGRNMAHVKDFGAVGDGQTDDTVAIQHAIEMGEGVVEFGRGNYRISRTIPIDLAKHGRTSITGSDGVAKVIMAGAGPAFFFQGTHAKTADPNGFRPEEWELERMPMVSGIEITGDHPEADGIRIEGVMQPTLRGVLIRQVHTAVHLTSRNRNVIIDHCHFYHNTGVGIHMDNLNLHQCNITGNHISYNRLGGIRIENSEIRNLQITGNDIEYNNNRAHQVPDADSVPTAEIYIHVGEGSVREATIASNTIQATYSPNGANIHLIGTGGGVDHKMGMTCITGNLIGSQETNVLLESVRGITLTGNYIYSGHHRNLWVRDSRNIVVGSNVIGHNPDYRKNELATGVRFENSKNCILQGTLIQDSQAGKHTVPGTVPIERDGLVELVGCRGMTLSGVQILEGEPYSLYVEDCEDTVLNGCTILDQRSPKQSRAAIRWKGSAAGNMIAACRIGKGTQTDIESDDDLVKPHLIGD